MRNCKDLSVYVTGVMRESIVTTLDSSITNEAVYDLTVIVEKGSSLVLLRILLQ